MTTHTLKAGVRWLGSLAIVELEGDIDGDAEGALDAAYTLAEEQDPAAILLSLAGVSYINSKGIALIVVLLSRAREAGRRLLACGLDDHYREIFEVTRLADYITICTDPEGVVAEAGVAVGLAARQGQRQAEAL